MTEEFNEEQTVFETPEDFQMKTPDGAKSFIAMYDNALEPEVCDRFIELFESNTTRHKVTETEGFRKFTELNIFDTELLEKEPEFNRLGFKLMEKVQYYTECYRRFWKIEFFPRQASNEEIRIKKYTANAEVEEGFGYHSDVGDYASARRFLVTMFYLNDVEEGGQTTFPEYKLAAKPTKGSLLIFPPFWTHPHQAEPPISNDKYIVSTYLHYL